MQEQNEALRRNLIQAIAPDAGMAAARGRPADAQACLEWLALENAKLRAEVAGLRSLLDGATEFAIITLDPAGRITGLHGGACAILGYEAAELLGQRGDVLLPAEDRAGGAFTTELSRAAEEGRARIEAWHARRDGGRFWASGFLMPLLGPQGQAQGFVSLLRDNSAAQAEAERATLRLGEMHHRMGNILATVRAIASQTLGEGQASAAARESLLQRLVALSASNDLLNRSGGEGAPLADVVARALAPYAGSGRVTAGGDPVWLPAEVVEMLSLAFHELATNAAKHGAFSTAEGLVEVSWTCLPQAAGPRLVDILWRERQGPVVSPPQRKGFGSQLLERALAQKLGGSVTLDFQPEGLECRVTMPVSPAG